jgi:hypothetical protein
MTRELTKDELAFMRAYSANVAEAEPHIVKDYLLMDGDDFYETYGTEYYTGLADAHGVWEDALKYVRENK